MIKNEDYPLNNKQISNEDLKKFCQVFEEKQLPYSFEVIIKNGIRYTYKYTKSTKEKNPFLLDTFSNMQVMAIKFKSKHCKLYYGENCDNIIYFEGDENDVEYQYLFTKIDVWKGNLKKLHRLKITKTSFGVFFLTIACLISAGIAIGYLFVTRLVNGNIICSIISSIILWLCLYISSALYIIGFTTYEIKIGLCSYKKIQCAFYSMFSLCIIPIILGLFI